VFGIPLTEEVLLKAGFKKSAYFITDYYIDKYRYSIKTKAFCVMINGDAFVLFYAKYLHTLQNFFQLTNKELNIDL